MRRAKTWPWDSVWMRQPDGPIQWGKPWRWIWLRTRSMCLGTMSWNASPTSLCLGSSGPTATRRSTSRSDESLIMMANERTQRMKETRGSPKWSKRWSVGCRSWWFWVTVSIRMVIHCTCLPCCTMYRKRELTGSRFYPTFIIVGRYQLSILGRTIMAISL